MKQSDIDKINALFSLTSDWSVVSSVTSHIKPYLDDRPDSEITKVELQMATGTMYRARSAATSNIKAVHVKLSDNTVVVISLERIYRVSRTYALGGDKRKAENSIKQSSQPWFVYVLECSDQTLYCGITTDVDRRVREHNNSKRGAKYTRGRRPVTLLKSWKVKDKSEATSAEKRFKRLSKQEKLDVVKGTYEKPTEDQHYKR